MNKYHATKETVDNIVFASRKEAKQYRELKLLERAGKIRHLELQKPFIVSINGQKIFTYYADFVFTENNELVVMDCKGFRTPVYRLKKRAVEAMYGIKIKET